MELVGVVYLIYLIQIEIEIVIEIEIEIETEIEIRLRERASEYNYVYESRQNCEFVRDRTKLIFPSILDYRQNYLK